MLDQPVPNPLAKNPNFHTHKVFAAIGIILIVMVIIGGGIWYMVQSAEDKTGTSEDTTSTKVATTSAKKSATTSSNTSAETAFSRDTKRRADLQMIKSAMQLFYNDCRVYPATLPKSTFNGKSFLSLNCGNPEDTYMREVPTDPLGLEYGYVATPEGCSNNCLNYEIGAVLENPSKEDLQTLSNCPEIVKVSSGAVSNFRVCND